MHKTTKKKCLVCHFLEIILSQTVFQFLFPKKDQCNICIKFKHGGVDVEDHKINKHVTNKNQARESKASDKNDEDPNHSVWTAGLQANLVSPKTNANAMYYKTELQVHNLTLYDLKNKNGYCTSVVTCLHTYFINTSKKFSQGTHIYPPSPFGTIAVGTRIGAQLLLIILSPAFGDER